MLPIPHEIAIGGVYLPPMLIAAILGAALAVMTGQLLNRKHWSQYLFYPPLVMLAMTTIYTVLIGTFIIGS
jgi:hypothetical protein